MRESCAEAMALSAVQMLSENYHSVMIPFLPRVLAVSSHSRKV
jgi:hypothetical protein